MRTIFAASIAAAVCFTAAPALAQSISDTEANALLAGMTTPAFDACTDSDKAKERPAMEQFNACQTALTELAQIRRKNPNATPGQKEVYGFYEAAIEMGNTFAMLRVDEKPSPRVCGNIEHQWVMANQSNSSVVGPELRGAQDSTKEAVRPLVKLCRETFPAPAGAPAV